jgi:hypothetical protein
VLCRAFKYLTSNLHIIIMITESLIVSASKNYLLTLKSAPAQLGGGVFLVEIAGAAVVGAAVVGVSDVEVEPDTSESI